MLEKLIGTLIQSQFGNVRRRAAGVVVEGAALGMLGLAIALLFLGSFFWLAIRVEAWIAAFILAGVALLIALILMLVGRFMMKRQRSGTRDQAAADLDVLSLLSQARGGGDDAKHGTEEPGPALVGAALAAGVLLGRSFKR
ncbi:phage holin family protein [Roseovarius aestuariivivens]|uniref:phage holin family protein n=1 Tax=Roseovarius aestuariivivens TaxID=1888910 RepID=UPI0010815832|nr:phage holin family protein [Roseovarius aestuariivivens]